MSEPLRRQLDRAIGIHDKLIECHPSLSRRQVWCTTCGHTQRVENGLRDGWPKHCGYTMTIDSPEEREALSRAHMGTGG